MSVVLAKGMIKDNRLKTNSAGRESIVKFCQENNGSYINYVIFTTDLDEDEDKKMKLLSSYLDNVIAKRIMEEMIANGYRLFEPRQVLDILIFKFYLRRVNARYPNAVLTYVDSLAPYSSVEELKRFINLCADFGFQNYRINFQTFEDYINSL